jgi:hypothetical protein
MVNAKQRLSACATPLPTVPEEVRDACRKFRSFIGYAAPVSAFYLSVILTRTAEVSSVVELPRFCERGADKPKSLIIVKR